MTIDEIIRIVEWRMSEDVEKDMIIAALKAAQGMRDAHKVGRAYDYYVAADAWDKATMQWSKE